MRSGPTPSTGTPGRVVADRYELVSLIGQGGMGCVWRARHLTLKTFVAVKLLAVDDGAERVDLAARFRREAQAVARLRGANVVEVFDTGVDEGTPFIAMELLEGESLRERLARGRLAEGEAATFLRGITRGLARAHRAGIVHRDLKPDNVFLAEDEEGTITVKLLDFGIAKLLPRLDEQDATEDASSGDALSTRTGATLGTPAYMSPEQVRGRPDVDERADLWAVAVIAFECVVGRRPFIASTFGELVMRICSEPMPIPSALGPVPDGFDDWFAKAANRDVDARFQRVEDLAEALGAVLAPGEAWGATGLPRRPRHVEKVELAATGRTPASPTGSGETATRERDAELVLLERVRDFWIRGVLDKSLRDELRVELSKEERPDAVARSFEVAIERFDEQAELLPREETIADFFERRQRAILILGDPGAGKTTALLELARELEGRASRSPAAPIPVVLTLSAWTDPRTSMADFVVAQLREAYRIPPRHGRAWLEQDRLALLFDGLDEVAEASQDACIEALDAFRDEHGLAPIAVTCRREDYAARRHRLKLEGALQLRDLDDVQIDAFVAGGGERLAPLAAALEDDPGLHELARSPLLLGIMSLSFLGGSGATKLAGTSADERRTALFDRFVARMTQRPVAGRRSPPAHTVRVLTWLARALAQRGETVFRLEHLQPAGLPVVPRLLYLASTRLLAGALAGLALGLAYRHTLDAPSVLLGVAAAVPLTFLDLAITARRGPLQLVPRAVAAATLAVGLAFVVLGLGSVLSAIGVLALDVFAQQPILLTGTLAVGILRRHLALTAGRDVTTFERVGLQWRRWAAAAALVVGLPCALVFAYLAWSDSVVRVADVGTFDGKGRSIGENGKARFLSDGRIWVRRSFERGSVIVEAAGGEVTALAGEVVTVGRTRFVTQEAGPRWSVRVAPLGGSERDVALERPGDVGEGERVAAAWLGLGERRAITQSDRGQLWLHDATTGRLLAKLGRPQNLRFVTVAGDDRHLALASFDAPARLLSLETGGEMPLPTHSNKLLAVDVHPTAGWLAGVTTQGCTVRVEPGAREPPVALGPCLPDPQVMRAYLRFSADGGHFLVATGGFGVFHEAAIRDAGGQALAALAREGGRWLSTSPMAIAADGRTAIVGGADGFEVLRVGEPPTAGPAFRAARQDWWLQPPFGADLTADGRTLLVYEPLPLGHYVGLALAALVGLLATLVWSMRSAPAPLKTRPDEAMLLTLGWSLGMTVVGAVFGAAVSLVAAALSRGTVGGATLEVAAGIALFFWLGFGGLDIMAHVALRITLALGGHLPLRAARFLDEAARRILLRRVGGGYVFVHRLLLEYFAAGSATRLGAGSARGALPEAPTTAQEEAKG